MYTRCFFIEETLRQSKHTMSHYLFIIPLCLYLHAMLFWGDIKSKLTRYDINTYGNTLGVCNTGEQGEYLNGFCAVKIICAYEALFRSGVN